ncbi:hypothetical protein BKA66DRAFT_454846 [Pyrenochaeta sp. MPI-SDFR-AT-0127]|nr:hypothetical protein BKA66DRAFT_454846 [Pyrenochaeta sp. MPI-SDFR-AT-0127]
MSNVAQRQRLRTKTGCLTCRSRRKKCDEKTPACDRCSLSGRACKWPDSSDLVDRRYTSHPRSRYTNSPEATICLRSESTTHVQATCDLEMFISRHFIEKFYNLLLLPGCHSDFHDGWIKEIQELMVENRSLQCSVLMNAASHIYNTDNFPGMRHRALDYYSQALRSLASSLAQPKALQLTKHNGVLSSVMLLYLHGCVGLGTSSDIPPHLSAAMNLLTLRLSESPLKISRPFDRLALESVLYQVFLGSTGLWSDSVPYHSFDLQFWLQTELLLEQSILFPGHSYTLNSPVLGIPVPLYRLAIQVKNMYQNPLEYDLQAMEDLRNEVEAWEATVLCNRGFDCLAESETLAPCHVYYQSTSYLFALIFSLLLDQMSSLHSLGASSFGEAMTRKQQLRTPYASPSNSWQIQKAIQILEKHQDDDQWANCFIGTWPVYTLGFFLEEMEHIHLIRKDLNRRWELTRFMQAPRFLEDLETIWSSRLCASPTLYSSSIWSCTSPMSMG